MLFSKNRHSNSLKALVYIAKQRPKKSAVYIGDPNGRPQKKQPVAVFSRRRNETC